MLSSVIFSLSSKNIIFKKNRSFNGNLVKYDRERKKKFDNRTHVISTINI